MPDAPPPNARRSSTQRPTLLQWLLLHTLAGIAIGALEAGRLQFMATLVLSGLVVGMAQAWVLRRVVPGAVWTGVSAIGWLLGIQITIGLNGWLSPIAAELTQFAGGEVFWLNVVKQSIVLMTMAIAQTVGLQLLRQSSSRELGLGWIAASGIAGAVQGGSSTLFCAAFCAGITAQLGAVLSTALVYGVGWFGYSLITAVLLQKSLFLRASEYRSMN